MGWRARRKSAYRLSHAISLPLPKEKWKAGVAGGHEPSLNFSLSPELMHTLFTVSHSGTIREIPLARMSLPPWFA